MTAANGVGQTTSQLFTLTVQGPPAITSAPATTFTAGVSGRFTVTTQAGLPATTTLAVQGNLPVGISFTDNGDGTGLLAGSTAETGSFPLLIAAENGVAPGDLQSFTLTVVAASMVPLPPSLPPADGQLSGLPSRTGPGQVVHVHGTGFAPGSVVTLGGYSPRTPLGQVRADATGAFDAELTLRAVTGPYTLLAAGRSSAGDVRYLEATTVISAAPASASTSPSSAATSPAPTGSTGLASTGPRFNPLDLTGVAGLLALLGLGLLLAARRTRHRH